jgi:hypothetical protein
MEGSFRAQRGICISAFPKEEADSLPSRFRQDGGGMINDAGSSASS